MFSRRRAFVIACTGLLAASAVFASDWPQFLGPARDGKAAGFTAPATWPKELTTKWKVDVGLGDTGPVLVGDRVFAFGRKGTTEVTTCLDAATGKEIWSDKYEAQAVTGAAARGHTGPRSTPLVTDGKVVTLGAAGVLTFLDAASGKRLWQKDEFPKVVPQFFVGMSPIAVDGLVIAHLGGPNNTAIEAFDLKTGDVKWKWTGDSPGYASPVLLTVEGTKQIVTLANTKVVSIGTADGKLLWELPFPASGMGYNAASVVVDGATVIFTGQSRGTTAVKVEKKGDAFTTTQLWKSTTGTQFNTPVLKDGLLYGVSDRGQVFCLKASTGDVAWTSALSPNTNYAHIVDAGSVLFALPSNSNLLVFKPGAEKYDELAKYKVSSTAVYGCPIIDGHKIYVRDDTNLYLMSLDAN